MLRCSVASLLDDDGVVELLPGPRVGVEAGQEETGGPVARLDHEETETDRQLEERENITEAIQHSLAKTGCSSTNC